MKDEDRKENAAMLEAGKALSDFVKGLLAQGWKFPITEVAVGRDGSFHAYRRVEMEGGKLVIDEIHRHLPHERMIFPVIYTFVDAGGRMQTALLVSAESMRSLLPDSGIVQ